MIISHRSCHLIEDEFDSLKTIYFAGNDYNADEFVSTDLLQIGKGSWAAGQKLVIDVPLEHKDGQVEVKLHIRETLGGTKQQVQFWQEDEKLTEGKAYDVCVIF